MVAQRGIGVTAMKPYPRIAVLALTGLLLLGAITLAIDLIHWLPAALSVRAI